MTQAPQKGFQLTPEDKTLILKKNSTEIRFDKKMTDEAGEGFKLTTKFYKSANEAPLFDPKKRKPEGKGYIQTEGTAAKKKEIHQPKNRNAENSCK